MANNGRSVDLEALLGRVQGMPIYSTKREERVQGLPIYSTPVKINQEPGLNDIVRNLEQKFARIMTNELDKFQERVQKMPIYSTPVKVNQEPGLDNIVRNLEQQLAQIRIAQLDKFEERVQGLPTYSTPVNINQEPSLADMLRKVEQQMERIMTAQLDKLEQIVGVVNSLGAGYEQMNSKFEKLHADVTVLRARIGDANSAEIGTGVLRPGVEKASHDDRNDAQGGVMRIAANTCDETHDAQGGQGGMLKIAANACDEIHTEMEAGRCRVSTAQNADSISHVSKIHSLCNEKNGEPENIPSTHGDLSKNSAGTGLDRSIKRRYTPVFAFEEKYDDNGVEVGPRPLW